MRRPSGAAERPRFKSARGVARAWRRAREEAGRRARAGWIARRTRFRPAARDKRSVRAVLANGRRGRRGIAHPASQVGEQSEQLGADRPQARRRRSGRSAQVGGMVDQRRVGLVADRRDQRDRPRSAAARTTSSSLKAHKSSIEAASRGRRSQVGRGVTSANPRMAEAILPDAPRPGPARPDDDVRRAAVSSRWRMSRITAPVGEVTTRSARQERQLTLREASKSPCRRALCGGARAAPSERPPGELEPVNDD